MRPDPSSANRTRRIVRGGFPHLDAHTALRLGASDPPPAKNYLTRIYAQDNISKMDVFEAVAEPSRRALLDLLAERERPAGELVASLPRLTQPAVSRHLRVLREVGLVEVRPAGQRRIYVLRAERLIEVDNWISRYRKYWPRHLDALQQHLAQTEEEATDG